jgi:hypothetical protein
MIDSHRSGRSIPVATGPGGTVALLVLLLLAVAVGLYARLDNLGERPIAIDEYYSIRSAEYILERGLPEFPSGGYYLRGPFLQYLSALSALVFGPEPFAYRLPPLLFGLLAVPLGYVYARRFVDRPMAVAVVIALLLSSWMVEFARFARMYTLLQCLTLAFLITLHDATFRGRQGMRYAPHLAVLAATFNHELGALLAPLLLLPLVRFVLSPTGAPLETRGAALRYGLISLVTIALCLVMIKVDLRGGLVDQPFPMDYVAPARIRGMLNWPVFPFWPLPARPLVTLLLMTALAGMIWVTWWQLRHRGRRVDGRDLGLALAVLTAVFHLFVLSAALLGWLALRHDLLRVHRQPWRIRVMLGLVVLLVTFWLVRALVEPVTWPPAVQLRWDLTESGHLKALWTVFFGWPDLYPYTLRPFITEMPTLGLMALIALGWALWTRRHQPLEQLLGHPALLVIYMIVLYGMVNTEWSVLRYWFHLYPVLLVVVAMMLKEATDRLQLRSPSAAAFGFLLLFTLSGDFDVRHLWNAGGREVSYRLGPFAAHELTWYPRSDYAGPARFAARAAPDDARIVVENLPPASWYLPRPHAVFYPREGNRFLLTSREQGTVELWSNQPLLSTAADLAAYAAGAEELWIIRAIDRIEVLPDLDEVFDSRLLERERLYTSADGRIEVLRLRLASGTQLGTHRLDDPVLIGGLQVGVHG